MKLRILMGVAALTCAACTHTTEHSASMAQVDGDQHIVVRAEAGHLWWSHRAWSEPHELWALPAQGEVQNLAVGRVGDGFIVTFDQDGTTWSGTFGETTPSTTRLARSGR
ncbi:MAG TPA: hypothetical protein VGH28_23100 [Polyangiaceae bacterium]|jgi:streptogramin lyase